MRKSFKQIIIFGMTAILGVSALAGCQKTTETKTDKQDKKVQLTMALWGEPQQRVMDTMIAAYEKEHPNVTVKTQLTTWNEYWTKIEAAMSGGDACDILWMNILHVDEYASGGVLKDLSEIGKNLKIEENFPKALVKGYTIDGKLYAIPKDFDTNGLFYNKELFDRAGLDYPTDDWTMEDFKNACVSLKAANLGDGVYPTAINYNTMQTNYGGTIYANGGNIYDDAYTKTEYSNPKTLEGMQVWLDLVKEGYSPTVQQMADTVPDAMFEGGKLAMYLSGNYMIAQFQDNEIIKGKYDVVQRPSFNEKKTDIINGLGYSVYENTKHEKEALEFIEWLGGKEAMDIQGKGGVVIPARNESQSLYLNTHPDLNLDVFMENLGDTYVLPHCKVQSKITTVVNDALQKAWAGDITLEEAAQSIDQATPAILSTMHNK